MDKLWKNWQKAMLDLGLDIVAPFKLQLQGDIKLCAVFLVKDFGAPKGTLVFTNYNEIGPFRSELHQLGYTASVFDRPSDEEEYKIEDFISLLCDWGWSGDPNAVPEWVVDAATE